jgi:diguanylate cyclase (GGDEF)-like protein
MQRREQDERILFQRGPASMGRPNTKGGRHSEAAPLVQRLNDAALDRETDLAGLRRELGATSQDLETLYAALDHVNSGIMILDADLHARYSNPVLHRMFNALSAGQIRNERPFYGDLLLAAAATSAVDLEDYVARRLAWVASGDAMATDLSMSDGTVLRCQLARLPNGGRVLIYSDVTDIVRAAQEMERLATIDGMTGIYNRRHFMALADREWDRARRYGRPLSFLMIDIDHFKAINDRFGHEIGDRAIVHVANLAEGCKRTSDMLARIGGEEFALLLPETEIAQAEAVAERLRFEVARSPLAEVDHSATVSIGVATADAAMAGISDLMKMADQALYAAKRTGRNRVMSGIAATAAPPLTGAVDFATVTGNEHSSEPAFEAGTSRSACSNQF